MNPALRLHGAGVLRLADEPVPEPATDDLLLRVTAVGLCGSDRHAFLEGGIGGTPLVRPLVLGHEVAGVVDAGPLKGTRMVIDPAVPCRACATCLRGAGHLCAAMRFAGLDAVDGGLQRFLAWPADRCVPVPEGLADREAPLLEVLGIALHAIDLARVQPGMRAGVYGAGPVGLVLIRALLAAGVEVSIATDVLPHRVEAARASGAASASLDVPGDTISVDVAFECAGEEAALDRAVRDVAPGGRVLLVGIPEGVTARYAASPARRKELGLQWVRRMAEGDLERAASLVRGGSVGLDGLVTSTWALTDAATAFEALRARSGLKLVVQPQG